MADKGLKERGWEKVQIKAFTSWLNGYLEKRDMTIVDISTDLNDGVKLINFLELLSNKRIGQRYDEKPPSRIQKIQNLHIALTFLEKEIGVKSTTSAEDFVDNNMKMILGFFWTLFKKFRIQTIKQDDKSSEEGLLLWVKKTTAGYRDVNVESYKHSFRNGMAFLALCDKYIQNPEVLNFDNYQKENTTDNLAGAFDYAEKHLGIPKLLEPQEVADGNIDERSLVLYISLYFHAFVAKEQLRGIQEERDRIEGNLRGLQGTLEERAKMAEQLDAENKDLKSELERIRSELEELKKEKESLTEKNGELTGSVASLEGQVTALQGSVTELTTKLENETTSRQKESEEQLKRATVENAGLGVLKKNLEEHIEDLRRWQHYLDFDKLSEVDFTGEIRPQILAEITSQNFDEQLKVLAKKLELENMSINDFLKIKETEKKAKKEAEKKKKDRQGKNKNNNNNN